MGVAPPAKENPMNLMDLGPDRPEITIGGTIASKQSPYEAEGTVTAIETRPHTDGEAWITYTDLDGNTQRRGTEVLCALRVRR